MFTQNANKIFAQAIDDYHRYDDVDHQLSNPYAEGTIDHLLYMKNWVDTVQWHLEDIIRDPRIDPGRGAEDQTPHRQVEPGSHRHGGVHRLLPAR